MAAARVAATSCSADVLLVGGGLASSLIALRLKRARPALKIIMLERDARIGGEHTWCHFATDVSPAISEWLGPLIAHDWAGLRRALPRPPPHPDRPTTAPSPRRGCTR